MSDKNSLNWYINRLSAMPFDEIALRVKRKIVEKSVSKAIKKTTLHCSTAKILETANTSIGHRPLVTGKVKISDFYLKKIIEDADNVHDGKIKLFNKNIQLDNPVNWFRDYGNKVDFPKIDAKKLNYKDPEQVDGIMYVWWLNRHQHLMPAAIAYYETGEQKYADVVLAQLQSWLDVCSFPVGQAWLTGNETGIRLITWSWLFRFLFAKGKPDNYSDDFLASWFISIKQHVHYIDTHWAQYSRANNHIIAEAVGVLAAVDTWPQLFPDKNYRKVCRDIIQQETCKQISRDGVNREHSISYHALVLELLINASVFDKCLGEKIHKIIKKMALFLNTLSGDSNIIPDIGDSDYAVASGIIPRSPKYYSYVASAACAFAEPQATTPIYSISKSAEWYSGTKVIEKKSDESVYFEDGGYAIWKSFLDSQLKINLCMNLADLGYGQIASHGHADALAFTLQINDEPVLIDPGTYAFHNKKKWRNYFKGTSAHNTLTINGTDQAEIKGPFLWSDKYYVRTKRAVMGNNQLKIKAEHDGYCRNEMTLTHRRDLSWHPLLKKCIIKDELIGNGNYNAELHFHVHPDRKVTKELSNAFKISDNGYSLIIKFSSHFKCRVACGETDPPLGWFSPVLGEKIPSPTIIAKGKVLGFDNIFTELRFYNNPE